jgi:hypothetical protein
MYPGGASSSFSVRSRRDSCSHAPIILVSRLQAYVETIGRGRQEPLELSELIPGEENGLPFLGNRRLH